MGDVKARTMLRVLTNGISEDVGWGELGVGKEQRRDEHDEPVLDDPRDADRQRRRVQDDEEHGQVQGERAEGVEGEDGDIPQRTPAPTPNPSPLPPPCQAQGSTQHLEEGEAGGLPCAPLNGCCCRGGFQDACGEPRVLQGVPGEEQARRAAAGKANASAHKHGGAGWYAHCHTLGNNVILLWYPSHTGESLISIAP